MDLSLLQTKLFQPTRARLEEVRLLVEELEDPSEAWHALFTRGVIPGSWIDPSSRCFYLGVCSLCKARTKTCEECGGKGFVTRSYPTKELGIALSCDPRGIETCEAIALEVVSRLSHWGVTSSGQIQWRATHKDFQREGDFIPWWICRLVHFASYYYERELFFSLMKEVNRLLKGQVTRDVFYSKLWERLSEKKHPLPNKNTEEGHLVPEGMQGKKFSELPNPFAPLLDIWMLGYAPESLSEDAIVLAAPV